ncbi:MAG: dienelactone hydrolase family protein [Acidimicrobiia bacterium]
MSRETVVELEHGPMLQADLDGSDEGKLGIVVFAHGTGSSRHSSRNRHVAAMLNEAGFQTLLLDLLTPEEEEVDLRTGEHRFDIGLLGGRVTRAVDWVRRGDDSPLGLFGASTGAAAALVAAAARPEEVAAVVSRGGRPDLAGDALPLVRAPTLLIVGGRDLTVMELNVTTQTRLEVETALEIVPGATHLFEEPGALDFVADLAAGWFRRHLTG